VLFALAAIVWGLACARFAWRYPRASRATVADGFDAELRTELDEARSDAERVAAVNELLAGIERRLRAQTSVPKVAGWMTVAGVALVLILGVLQGPEPILALGLVGLLIGVAGAVVARRVGDRAAETARARADDHVSAAVGTLYDAEIVLPTRPQRRFRRR